MENFNGDVGRDRRDDHRFSKGRNIALLRTTVEDFERQRIFFTAVDLDKLMNENGINLNTALEYSPMLNSRDECMVGTIKKSVERRVGSNRHWRPAAMQNKLFGYRRRQI